MAGTSTLLFRYIHDNTLIIQGQAKPSKKGITLSKQEWMKMLAVQNEVEFEN
jgi:Transcriptional Coactivator p15 (PC4)